MPPIYATSTYAQSSPGVHKGYDYARTAIQRAARGSAALPTSRAARTASRSRPGMAATATLLELHRRRRHIVAMNDLYGGTFRVFERVRRRSANLDISFVDLTQHENLVKACVRRRA